MKVLIAPDSFKGTLSSDEVCDIIEKAALSADSSTRVIKIPLSDGGEGLCSCFSKLKKGRMISESVSGVFGEPVNAEYFLTEDLTAVIEMAACAGLPLAGERKNPMITTTAGVGELLLSAVRNGAQRVILGLGGSATNDCGIGMASALGYRFLDKDGAELPLTGASLSKICSISKPDVLPSVPVTAACDVSNPLYGENGAAFVYAPQKGADKQMVYELDNGLRNIAGVIEKCLDTDVSSVPGGGAAGGMGAGVLAFLKGSLHSGIDIILDECGFDSALNGCDIVITGEGRLDSQSVNGKVISGVCKRAVKAGVRVVTVCGCKGEGYEKARDIGVTDMYFSSLIPKPMSEIVRTCKDDLYNCAAELFNNIKLTL